jgi:exopolyphosphatase/guanosine-5'-triphosphate,3'-diphosphate pyrophosphatase
LKLAAIDIGSNAARLLVTEVSNDDKGNASFDKISLIRIPLRLGFDVFDTGRISPFKTELLLDTMRGFHFIAKAYQVEHLKACATSAMRDALNTPELLIKIKDLTGIDVEVISGSDEASLVFENHIAETLTKDHSYLYIDVGGGSTEVTFFSNGKVAFKESFNIGTIRLLKNKISEMDWDEMKSLVKEKTKGSKEVVAIGSGGNINKIYSLSRLKDGKPLPLQLLRDYYKELSNATIKQRINLYKLKDDRADVIVPALQIYVNIMRWSGAQEILVPRIGLADGLIHHLWENLKKSE